jgi:ankyrin repeat protein
MSEIAIALKEACIASLTASALPLHLAVLNGDIEAIKQSTDDVNQPTEGITPLLAAITLGQDEALQILLEKGASPHADLTDFFPVHIAAACDNQPALRILLAYGADVNALALNNNTPLYIAVSHQNAALVQFLLNEAKADPTIGTAQDGQTPLHLAIALSNEQITTYLIEAGADINAITTKGDTPLLFALLSGNHNTVQILLDAGADTSIAGNQVFLQAWLAAHTGDKQAIEQSQTMITQQQEKEFIPTPLTEDAGTVITDPSTTAEPIIETDVPFLLQETPSEATPFAEESDIATMLPPAESEYAASHIEL